MLESLFGVAYLGSMDTLEGGAQKRGHGVGHGAGHGDEPHAGNIASRLNWLRAGVLGANDGIVSIAGLVVGVAAAGTDSKPILMAGVAGLVAGAASMAMGEYVSVSTQRDTEKALLAKEAWELETYPEEELRELAGLYRLKGLSKETAHRVAAELTEKDALAAHAEIELGIDPDGLTSPWHAAISSAIAFVLGAMLPLLAILLPPENWRVPVTFVAVLIALALTGSISARLGGAKSLAAVRRVMIGGAIAMAVTYAIGELVGKVI